MAPAMPIHAMLHTNNTQELSHKMLEAQRVTRYIPERSWDDHRMTASFDFAKKYEHLEGHR